MGTPTTTSLLLSLAVVLTACGGDDDADLTVASSAASESAGGDGSSLEGVAIPLAPGAEAVSDNPAGDFTVVQFFVPVDRLAGTIAFYADWTDSQPEAYQRVEAESGGVSWQNDPQPGGEKHLIAVVAPLEGDDRLTVTLTVGPAE